jgi:hypothetical protein
MRAHGCSDARFQGKRETALVVMNAAAAACILTGTIPVTANAQHAVTAATVLVFDGVTIVDVEQGKLVPDQRVVITGNRIEAMGGADAVKLPRDARVVDARGKYLIPGLWDLHVHPNRFGIDRYYSLFLANGVTGIRDPGSSVPLDTLNLWRREILAGTRGGPVRQILSGQTINGPEEGCVRTNYRGGRLLHTCVSDTADARHFVDSIKTYSLSKGIYFVIAAEARRLGLPFGGHISAPQLTAIEASDSGASILDHVNSAGVWTRSVWGRKLVSSDAGRWQSGSDGTTRGGYLP